MGGILAGPVLYPEPKNRAQKQNRLLQSHRQLGKEIGGCTRQYHCVLEVCHILIIFLRITFSPGQIVQITNTELRSNRVLREGTSFSIVSCNPLACTPPAAWRFG